MTDEFLVTVFLLFLFMILFTVLGIVAPGVKDKERLKAVN
jgi:hypothetical protein